MALAPFFSRAYSAIGAHLGITREELKIALSGHIVGIHLGEACSVEGNEKWIAELLVNLLARLYPSLSISGCKPACKNISKIAHAINPNIKIMRCPDKATVVVSVGDTTTCDKGFSASASGWVAHVGRNVENGPLNPYSAGAAAALATWRVFQTVFARTESQPLVIPDISLSLLDYGTDSGKSDPLPPVDLGEVAVAGIGAVGNPALWAWARHAGLSGELHLIDPEDVELSNLQRYCLPVHADVRMSKVQIAERELRNSNLSLKLWPCSLEDFASNYSGIGNLPTICVSVDNIDGRRAAQALLPRLVINGWTSDNGLGASWHRFLGNSACLGCFYHPKGASLSQTELAAKALGIPHDQLVMLWVTDKPIGGEEIQTIENYLGLSAGKLAGWAGKRVQDVYTGVFCGQVGIDLTGIGRVATVPLAHQSVLAGILMAAELVKRSDSALQARSQSEPLIIWDDVMRTPPKYWAANRQKEAECFCGDVIYQKVFSEKWDK
jgi:ThiF family